MCSLRGDNLLIKAFHETAAPLGANVVLLLEIVMGIGLLLGARLARMRTEATSLTSTSGPLKRSVDMAKHRQNYATAVNTEVNMPTSAPRSGTGKAEAHAERAESGTFRLILVWNASC